jgi:hypothetical protein
MGEARQRKAAGLGFKEKAVEEKRMERSKAKADAKFLEEKNSMIQELKDNCGEDGWVWCLHCERVYKPEEVRYDPDTDLFMCFYPDCGGDAVMDAFSYEQSREVNHPDYPVIPERGVVYSQY